MAVSGADLNEQQPFRRDGVMGKHSSLFNRALYSFPTQFGPTCSGMVSPQLAVFS